MPMEFKSQEIPEGVPFEEYGDYIDNKIDYRYLTIAENDWGEYERKEWANIMPRIILLWTTKQEVKREGWTKRTLWHKEIIQKGYDLDIPEDEYMELLNRF